MCPQANVSETLLGGFNVGGKAMNKLLERTPRASVAGYIEERLSSPFHMIPEIDSYVSAPHHPNPAIPRNVYLICGDNLLEIVAEAIRQTSQLAIPVTAWKLVQGWLKDLVFALRNRSGSRDSAFFIDCNPSFAIYTQLAVVAADYVVVPFTADDSSRRAVENIAALLYGVGDSHISQYSRINFAQRAGDEGVATPTLHTFVSNRVTYYEDKPSKAFEVSSRRIKDTVKKIHEMRRSIFASPGKPLRQSFVEIPDYHSASIVAATTGTPLHMLKPGPKSMGAERVQINVGPLNRYKVALSKFVDML
tara:strand:- start:157507 stop:158424 length:918 start_codon:yes stop_codon:yes gene_type:complete